jgi:hypothetical protein
MHAANGVVLQPDLSLPPVRISTALIANGMR